MREAIGGRGNFFYHATGILCVYIRLFFRSYFDLCLYFALGSHSVKLLGCCYCQFVYLFWVFVEFPAFNREMISSALDTFQGEAKKFSLVTEVLTSVALE
jgi:hypothetical protein